ncbi:MAG: hypothetical protein Ct9H90mP24_3520 [Methanobacteriota archaeon]|nr:MAG: hypothetical protein Ct9H90mP24_3520 [Euryarchaeota archaeon]
MVWNQGHEKKVSSILGGVAATYLVLCFLAPLLMPTDSVPELSGRANAIDYAFESIWGEQGPRRRWQGRARSISAGGKFRMGRVKSTMGPNIWLWGLELPPKHERSWEINGNQMPVCARDIGIFLGFSIGCLIFGLRGFNRWTVRDTFLSVFPDDSMRRVYEKDVRLPLMLFIMGLGLVPWGRWFHTTSSRLIRVKQSPEAGHRGWGWTSRGLWFSSAFSARPKFFEGADGVELPAGSNL